MNEERLEKLQEQYIQAIELLENPEDIKNNLPKPYYNSFYILIKKIISRIDIEIKTLLELKETEKDLSSLKEIEETINLWYFKQNICKSLLQEAVEEEKISKEISTKEKINLIFATNNRSTYIENDLKDIPNEWYDSVIELIERIKNGELGEQYCNNNLVSKIYKLSTFKVRLIYRILDNNTLFIMRIKMKKSTNDKSDLNDIVTRCTSTNVEFKLIKEKIKNPIEKQKLIEENEKILELILGYIKQNKRG